MLVVSSLFARSDGKRFKFSVTLAGRISVIVSSLLVVTVLSPSIDVVQ